MPNTISQRTLFGDANTKIVARSIHIISDGTEVTDLVIYDNSAFIADVTKGKVIAIHTSGSFAGSLRFEFDATTDTPITSMGIGDNAGTHHFEEFGGIKNPGGAGVTGDITLTTTKLANLDEVHIIIEIEQ